MSVQPAAAVAHRGCRAGCAGVRSPAAWTAGSSDSIPFRTGEGWKMKYFGEAAMMPMGDAVSAIHDRG